MNFNSRTFHLMTCLAVLILLSAFQSDQSVQTSGDVDFTVKTVTYNGDRSPKNIVAVWVEDASGNFVKTLLLQADRRKQWLLTWNDKSGGSTTDAVTGATLDNHQKHDVTWDCTDETGAVVEDGDYKIVVEFTEEHAQGPLTSVTFSKTSQNDSVKPPDQTNFIEMSLFYTSLATGASGPSDDRQEALLFPNPFTEVLSARFAQQLPGTVEFRVYGINGQLIREILLQDNQPGEHTIQWNGLDHKGIPVNPGVYLIEIRLPGQSISASAVKY